MSSPDTGNLPAPPSAPEPAPARSIAGALRELLPPQATHNIGWLAVDKIGRMGVLLLVSVWTARQLGPTDYGALNYALVFGGVFNVLAGLGLDSIVVRELVRRPERTDEILGTSAALKLAGAAVSLALAIGCVTLVRAGDGAMRLMVAIVVIGSFFQALDPVDYWFQSRLESRYSVWGRGGAFTAISAFKIGLLVAHAPLLAFAVAALLEIVIGAAGLALAFAAAGRSLRRWRFNGAIARQMAIDAWPLALSQLAVMLYMRSGAIILRELHGEASLGVYSAATRLVEAWYFVPMSVVPTVFPAIIRAKLEDEPAFLRGLQRLFDLMAIFGYAVAIPATLLAKPIVRLLYGETYSGSAAVLAIYAWCVLFTALGVARSPYLMAMNWTRHYLATTLVGGLVNLALNALLIPTWGRLGAAVAALVASATAAVGACLLWPRLWPVGAMLLRSLLAPIRWAGGLLVRGGGAP